MNIIIALWGLVIGSFLNVCIYRIPRGESLAFPSSHCPSCENKLKYYNLIPMVSYLIQGGKCSYCGEKISPQYPLVELINMLLYLGLYYRFNWTLDLIFYSIILSLGLVITFIDLKHMIIPDSLVLAIFILNLIQKMANYYYGGQVLDLKSGLIAGLVGGLIFLLIYLVSGGAMGEGDIILISCLGFMLTWKLVVLNIILSFILGAIVSIGLLAFKIKDRKDPIPFGPFIMVSFTLVLFYGEEIINFYLDNFIYI